MIWNFNDFSLYILVGGIEMKYRVIRKGKMFEIQGYSIVIERFPDLSFPLFHNKWEILESKETKEESILWLENRKKEQQRNIGELVY
jgi:hypothetical protein